MVDEIRRVSTTVGEVYLDEHDICRIELDSTQVESLDVTHALTLCNAICELCDNQPRLILTDARGVNGFVDPKARNVFRDHPGFKVVRLAEAFVVDSLANRLLASFYMKFDRPPNPTKVFGDVDAAIAWLKKVKA